MKEIKKEKTTVQTYYEYEAVDGTIFKSEEECRKYEDTARCVLVTKFKRLIVTKEFNAWSFIGGLDDDVIVGIKFNCEDDIKDFLQYYCLDHPHYMQDQHKTDFQNINNKCYDAMKNDDILLVGINCNDECYIIKTVKTIINNLQHITDKDEVSGEA